MGVPTEGMEEFYIPTTGGAYRGAGAGAGAGAGFAPTDYSTGASSRSEDRRRDVLLLFYLLFFILLFCFPLVTLAIRMIERGIGTGATTVGIETEDHRRDHPLVATIGTPRIRIATGVIVTRRRRKTRIRIGTGETVINARMTGINASFRCDDCFSSLLMKG